MQLGLIPTLFLFFGLLSLIYAAALHYWLRHKAPVAVDHLTTGISIWGIAVILTTFRSEIPLYISYFLANSIAFTAHIEMNRGLLAMSSDEEKKSSRYLDGLCFLAYFASLYGISEFTPAPWRGLAMTAFVSVAVSLLAMQSARICFLIANNHGIQIASQLGYLYWIVATLWAVRIPIGLADMGTNAFDTSLLNTFLFIGIFISGVLRYLIFPLLILQKAEKKSEMLFKNTVMRANKLAAGSALTASIAHELNQPLTAISINAQVLRKNLEKQSEGQHVNPDDIFSKELIDDLLVQNERASQIIISLRRLFKSDHVKIEIHDSSVLIQNVLAMVAKELDNLGIELSLQICDDLPISIAEDEFNQVLMNLILNSMQAMKNQLETPRGRLLIGSSQVGQGVEITVSDNGPGVNSEIKKDLFNIALSTKNGGMGIGLWLCKHIIERHGGTIEEVSPLLGGATFKLNLPLARP